MNNIKTIKKTTQKQFEALVDFMCRNPNIAKGYHKNTERSSVKEQWNDIQKKLNSIGPPTRETEGWMKVWADMKTSVKKKLIHNKMESRATGGGPFQQKSLTSLEEAVSGLLQMESVVSPNGPTFGIETVSANLDEELHENELNDSVENMIMNFQTNPSPRTKKKIIKKTAEKNLLLEQQLSVQTDLYKNLKRSLSEIERYSRKSYKLQEEQLNLQKEKIKLYKEHIKKKEINRSSMLKLRMDEIDIKRRKIEIEENRFNA